MVLVGAFHLELSAKSTEQAEYSPQWSGGPVRPKADLVLARHVPREVATPAHTALTEGQCPASGLRSRFLPLPIRAHAQPLSQYPPFPAGAQTSSLQRHRA